MKKIIFAAVCLMIILADQRAHAYGEGDFQVWNTEDQEFKFYEKTKIFLQEEVRIGDDASDIYYYHFDGGLGYDVGKYLDLGIHYRQVYEKRKGKFKIENRTYGNAILKYDLCGFKLSDRNRIEYRHFDWQDDSWRYRNKFMVKFPWKFTKMEIQPYVADEIFVPLKNDGYLSRNRFYAGLGFNLTECIKCEVYYLFQSDKSSGKWTDANVLGTKVKVIF